MYVIFKKLFTFYIVFITKTNKNERFFIWRIWSWTICENRPCLRESKVLKLPKGNLLLLKRSLNANNFSKAIFVEPVQATLNV